MTRLLGRMPARSTFSGVAWAVRMLGASSNASNRMTQVRAPSGVVRSVFTASPRGLVLCQARASEPRHARVWHRNPAGESHSIFRAAMSILTHASSFLPSSSPASESAHPSSSATSLHPAPRQPSPPRRTGRRSYTPSPSRCTKTRRYTPSPARANPTESEPC